MCECYIPIAMASGGDAITNYVDVARHVPTKEKGIMEEKKRVVFSISLGGERKDECVYVNKLSSLENLISYVVQYVYGTGNVLDERLRQKARQAIKEGKHHYFYEAEDMTVYLIDKVVVTYHRPPTPHEIKFGYGATHYLDVPGRLCLKKDGRPKKWLVNPTDGLRYYR